MIINNDCLDEMRKMEANSISCIVTDPPYGLHFMGKDWDSFKYRKLGDHSHTIERNGSMEAGRYNDGRNDEFEEFIYQFSLEALRIVKPGGHILMFGAPRRYHRQVCGLEDAGWEIRDCLQWIYGSGFPKSHNHFGIEGFGTALKPAYEPIIMAMKPCDGTFANNAEKWGQAGINIDGCRIGTESTLAKSSKNALGIINDNGWKCKDIMVGSDKGRWPANILFDEEAAKMLDEQSGKLKSGSLSSIEKPKTNQVYGKYNHANINDFSANSGGASRFFYCAKTSSKERGNGNNHPTVKPLKLMQYLIKLVMPPKDGILLDPFAGSGSTIVAAYQLGIKAIGIEKSYEYCEIARKRLESVNIIQEDKQQLDMFKVVNE